MRKFLRIFFWSHGAPLGYLGSLSQKGHPEIFSKWVLMNLSNPLRHSASLVDPLLTKNLDTAGPWCDLVIVIHSAVKIMGNVYSGQSSSAILHRQTAKISRHIHFSSGETKNCFVTRNCLGMLSPFLTVQSNGIPH